MRLPFTTTVPLATGRLLARILTASSSEASSSMIASAEPEHLMDWHGCGAEHHGDVDGNLVESGHVRSLLRSAATVRRYV